MQLSNKKSTFKTRKGTNTFHFFCKLNKISQYQVIYHVLTFRMCSCCTGNRDNISCQSTESRSEL